MNIKHFFISSSISILFGVYSIYNIIDYLKIMDSYYDDQITTLKLNLTETYKKYYELNRNYTNLNNHYESLVNENVKINDELKILTKKMVELSPRKSTDQITINLCNSNSFEEFHSDKYNQIESEPIYNLKIVEPILTINKTPLNTYINYNLEKETLEIIDYDCIDCNNIEFSSPVRKNSWDDYQNHSIRTRNRSRSTSITDLNWGELTKKFIFG